VCISSEIKVFFGFKAGARSRRRANVINRRLTQGNPIKNRLFRRKHTTNRLALRKSGEYPAIAKENRRAAARFTGRVSRSGVSLRFTRFTASLRRFWDRVMRVFSENYNIITCVQIRETRAAELGFRSPVVAIVG